MSNTLESKLAAIASSAINKNQKTRDGRNVISKSFDIATNKSFVNEDKKAAATAIRQWEKSTWHPKVAQRLKAELKTEAPKLKPGTPAYQKVYDKLYNKNYQELQAAKTRTYQNLGALRKQGQSQRKLDIESRQNDAIRNNTVGATAVAETIRDTASATSGAYATGSSRLLRAPVQLIADIGENDDGGWADRTAKALERHEASLKKTYGAYDDIQQNGSFMQKVALAGVEQIPSLAATGGVAGAAGKTALMLGASARTASLGSYATTTAAIMPQAYLDGSDSTKQELEGATSQQLATAERSQDIYKGFFDKNLKAGMSESEAYAKARDQTISQIAEDSGDTVGLATIAISMIAPGVGSQVANRINGGALTSAGRLAFNRLAVRAESNAFNRVALPTLNVAQIGVRNAAEEALQEGFTDLTAQRAALDVGVRDKIDQEQLKEAALMGGVLGGIMGSGSIVTTRGSGFQQAQDNLRASQQQYAQGAAQAKALQDQIREVSPRSPQGQELSAQLDELKASLNTMTEEAKARGIPRSSLARYAPRIEPINVDPEFDGNMEDSAELSDQEFEDILNGIDPTDDASQPQPNQDDTVEPQLSEQELDAQDEQLAQLIAEQAALDEAIEDGSDTKPLEESIAQASSWYDAKRGEGQQGLGGVVRRAEATEQDTIDAQRPPIDITGAINSYVADQRAQQNSLDAELERDTAEATTLRQKKEAELLTQQRDLDRAEAESMVAERVALAQPYEDASFDATVIGADNVPFNLGRFWDNRMSAPMKAQAIAKAFGGEVDQNIAKADWQSMPEGVQKQLHGWMTSQLDALRQSQAVEQAATNATEEAVDVEVPTSQQPVAVNGLTMPGQAIDAPVELTAYNPVVNIPAPRPPKSQPASDADITIGKDGNAKWFGSNEKAQAFITKKGLSSTHEVVNAGKSRFEIRPIDTTAAPVENVQETITDADEDANGVYRSQPAARAAMKRQKRDPKNTSVVKVDGGWALEESKPTKAGKPLNGDEFAELTSSRTTPSIKTGEPVVDKESTTDKTQNDVSDTEVKDRFADNKLFTSDKVAAARARLKAKMGQVNSGFDPEMAIDGMTLAGAYIESGVRKFGDYAKLMIDDFGDNIKPQLLSFWEGARNWDGLDTEGMTSVADSKREYDQLKAESEKASTPAKPLTLNQDWGVQKIDAYNVKTEFLKDAENYLNDVKDILKQKGYTSTVNNSGKPIKVVDTNQFGMQSSGAVQLTMQKDGVFVGVFIGNNDQTQNNSNHKQGIEIKVQSTPHEIWRLAQEFEWVDAKTTSQDLAKIIESHVAEKRKDKGANKSSTPAKPKYPQTVGSGPQMKTFVGENQSGLPLYENKSGVRAIEEYGIFNNETVSITPTGIEQQPREDRYLTKEELAAKKDNNNDAGTSNQDDQSRTDRGLLETEQADAEGRNAGAVQAESTSSVGGLDGDSARSDTSNRAKDAGPDATSQRTDAIDSDSRADSAQSNDGTVESANRQTVKARNFEIVPSIEDSKQPSWQKVAERNVMIIELLKKLDEQARTATPTEQAFLADYAGWGASEIANGIFPNPTTGEYKSNSWQALGEKLQSLLTDSEYATARQTTQYAHYTPPVLVKGIYAALEQFGFKGGQILEPASGVGVFNGLMPRGLASNSTYVGLELDPITGRIAQHLYPESNMKIADYIKAKLPDNHFDVAVGNPPFAGLTVSYKGTGKNVTKQALQLHDYFFAKTLDKLKPGGVMVFVTSKGTMDKTSSKTREYLAEQADLIGAIRLPQTAFKENAGTEVVTDIIFLRKRLEGEQPNDTAWTNVKTIKASGKPTTINEYFVNNPDMVLGEHAIVSGRFGDTYTVLPNKGNFESQVNDAIGKLPKDVFNPSRGSQAEAAKVQEVDYGPAANANKEGGVYLKDGQLMRVVDGVGSPLTQRYGTNGKPIDLSAKDIAFMTDYVGVRDALKQAQRDQLNDSESWEDSLANLNSTYDAFVKKHGPLMAHSVSERENDDGTTTVTKRFRNKQRLFLDVEGVLASALENIVDDGKGTVVKGSFFEGRSLRKPKMPTINTTQDAMIYALDETGVLDIKRIASLTNLPESRVIEELGDQIYNDPNSKKWDLSESYLSGNVVEKLAQAQEAAKTDKSYNRNVKALTEVQPRPIAPNDISSNMGAAWIPGNVINEFNQEILGANITAEYSKTVGLWDVGGSSSSSDYSTADRSTLQLVESILNSRKISITRKSPDGGTYTDSVATELANEVARKIKTQFKNWLWSDETRTQELAEYYNKTYNNIVPPTFNGDHLTLAGMSNKIQLRSPQKQGIYRVIRQGDVYLNHAVGAGKTFTMIAAAMEEKRLGLINKPMFVVPNHMLDQFSQEFLMLYPAANIMVADEQNFSGQNRKQFVAQAALNTPDAIIITHSGFERIGVKPATKEKFLQEKLNDWQDSLESTKQDDGDNRTSVKQMERNIESITRRLDETLDAKEKDGAVFFEELGVDKLYIDEAHEFRKLDFVTKMGNIKGIDPAGSQRAMDLDMKLQLLRGTNPTRAFVGASGTPVTNTMGELYTIQRYFQPQQLEQEGLHHFDSWANQFGEVVEGLEQNAAGNYEVIPRFARFVNVPELMSRVRSFMDVLTSQDLGDFVTRPNVRTGGREIVAIPTPDGFSDYQASLAARIDAIRQRSGKAEKGDDIILSVIGDGRFSAIDMRFVDPTLPSDPNSKLNTVIRDMAEAYHATANNSYMTDGKEDGLKGGALMMFTDIGLGEQSAATRGFAMKDWINSELIRLGVKPEDIAFMRDNKTHAKKGKLFDDMRQGRKRIMIGGKDMETGVNAQKRLTHLFHLDAPWFPASVEQREGRIIRQGNQNKEVTIKAYATKGSYDSTMWSMVARKARFIEQAMRGDMTVRSMDDVSEASAFEQASALSSGDPRSMQLAGLRQDVERLNRQLSGYQNEKFGNQNKAKEARRTLARAERELDDVNKLLPTHKIIDTGDVIGKVGDKAFDNRADYGQAIINEFNQRASNYDVGEHVLGNAAGYNVVYNGVMMDGGNFYADANIDIPKSDDAALFDTDNAKDARPDGLTTRIINRVNKLADYKDKIEQIIEQSKTNAENFERRAGKSFDSQTELEEKSRELKELEDTLANEAEVLKANSNPNNFTDADRVPAPDAPKFSRIAASDSQIDAIRKQYENTDQWMKSPNGKKTNLTEQQWLQVRTPAFKEWFGDWENDPVNASKVVDDNGEPMVVYHGSPTGGDFNTFTPSDDYNAVFFAENKDFAKKYTKINGIGQDKVKGNEKLFEVFLNAKNYFDYDNKAHVEKVIDTIFQTNETFEINDSERLILDGDKTMYDREVVGLGFLPGERNNNWDFIENEFVQEAIKVAGFDGFAVTEGQRNIAVYQPNQIKSADDNAGTFDASNPDIRYSKTNPAKGNTDTTSEQVISALQKHFGKEAVASLVKSGQLRVRTLNDFVNTDGELIIPDDAEGFFYDGKVTLIADNLTPDTVVATLLHELGGHAGIQKMLDPKTYASMMENFDALVASGNKYAVRAKERADASTNSESEARDEYIPYLITEYAQANGKGGPLAAIKRFVNRVMAGVRAWVRTNTGVNLKMTPNDMTQLAERMVKRLAEQSATDMTIADVDNMPASEMQFKKAPAPAPQVESVRKQYENTDQWMKSPNGKKTNLTEQQWLQVRTPAFKEWFGDWENDPVNASKVVDDNGEPLVLYHGAKTDFWTFDMGQSVKERNNGMDGMFFTDNAKMAAGYSVDLPKEKDVFAAKSNQFKTARIFNTKRYILEAEGKSSDEIMELTKQEYAAIKEAEENFETVKKGAYDRAFDNAASRTKAVFIYSQAPFEQDMKGGNFWEANKKAAENYATGIYDGIVNDNVLDDVNSEYSQGPAKVVISFDATNIKSATDNTGTFSKTNDDIRYSNLNTPDKQVQDVRKQYENTDQWMKSPNGKKTNLTEQQWLQVRTPAFKEWFGDWEGDAENASKIVDDNGEPMVVYHGTQELFNEFDLDMAGSATDQGTEGRGFYFISSIDAARSYANSVGGNNDSVISAFLSIADPYQVSKRNAPRNLQNDAKAAKKFTKDMKKQGYDGVEYTLMSGIKSLVAFDDTQIKSATANAGTFDSSNPDIRFSRKDNNPNQLGFDYDAEVDSGVAPKNNPAVMDEIRNDELRSAWRDKNKVLDKDGQKRTQSVAEAAQRYKDGEIKQDEYIQVVRTEMPIKPMNQVPQLPSLLDIGFALDQNKIDKEGVGIVGVNKDIDDDTRVGLRLDIPAYNNYDTWVVSIHDGTKPNGKSLGYAQTGYISNVEFNTKPLAALNIAIDNAKATIARMHGDWINHDPEALAEKAEQALHSDEWIEVGMNPFRHSWFYDKADGNPVVRADEVIQIGALVLARGAQKTSVTDPEFDTGPKGNNIKFSRRYSSLGTDGKPVTAREIARDRVALAQATAMSSKFGLGLLLRRHLATPQHVALLNPSFKVFTDNVQARIAYENNEAGLVQTYLPEIWDTRLVVGKKKAAMERVSKAIFDGTMADKVWTDSELQTQFNLTNKDMDFYRRSRQAIDISVANMTIDTLSALAKGTKLINIHTINQLKLQGLTPEAHNLILQKRMTDELQKLAKGGLITPKAEIRMQAQLDAVFDIMSAVAGKYDNLVKQGYAPLMRFGNYAVEVRDKATNALDLFELYETKGQQRKAIKDLKSRYDETKFVIDTGTLNPEGFKQFTDKGLSPETVQLFAAELGLDKDGAHQAYLKIAVSDRSALKRLIHRKKVPGYSEDMPRVLSSFVMSNARYSGRSLYNGEIEKSIQDIKDGNLQNEAQKVFENMEDPQEEFASQRSLMFLYFMGFSPAFFFLNLTQPFTQTIPKLTAYVGAGKGNAYMAQAMGHIGKHMSKSAINMGKNAVGIPTPNWKGFEDSLPVWVKKEDYLRMAREGHLDPQNIYMIKGLERGKGGVASGIWGNIQAAAGWFAEVSESINRRSTMIAAFRVAKDMGDANLKSKGFNSRYDFAVSVIQQTQGIYNKGNRSGLARGNGKLGQYGPLILVFKQFTINYTEQMIRHARDKEVKSLAVAMAWQFALAGMLGLPFADDLRDLFEGLAYRIFGKAFNLPDYLEDLLGKSNADALMYGLASEKGRIDLYGRSSLGNIIPGTDVARPGPTDWAEILGASSGFYESFFSAASMATDGYYKDALITASPRFVRDAASGAEIAITGSYRNTKGDKIMDLDKTDAVIKSLAFNPSNNARPGRDRSNAYNMKNMLKAKTDYFSKHLAEAMYQEDDDKVDELYDEMDAWNDRNADHFNVDIEKIEKSADKRVEKKDFGSDERQNIQDSLAERQEDLAGT